MLMEAFSDQMAQSWLKGHPSDSFPTLGLELGDGAVYGHPLPYFPPEPENFRTGVRMKLLPNCNINVRFKVEMYNRKWDASYVRLRGNRSERGKGKHETDTYKREGSD
jgi:hypothetical protein